MDDPRAVLQDLPLLAFVPAGVRNLGVDSCVPTSCTCGSCSWRGWEEADA